MKKIGKISPESRNICFLELSEDFEGTKTNEFESDMVNEPSVFELLRFDCINCEVRTMNWEVWRMNYETGTMTMNRKFFFLPPMTARLWKPLPQQFTVSSKGNNSAKRSFTDLFPISKLCRWRWCSFVSLTFELPSENCIPPLQHPESRKLRII